MKLPKLPTKKRIISEMKHPEVDYYKGHTCLINSKGLVCDVACT
jgi:hypothetical protein